MGRKCLATNHFRKGLELTDILKVAPYSFLTAHELALNSCDGASLKVALVEFQQPSLLISNVLAMHRVSSPSFEFYLQTCVLIFSKIDFKSSKGSTLLVEFRTRHWPQSASDKFTCVVVSKLYDVTNMQMRKTRAYLSRVSFGEIL